MEIEFILCLVDHFLVGLALLAFRAQVTSEFNDALDDWNPNEIDPCGWSGVHCLRGEVHKLYALHFQ